MCFIYIEYNNKKYPDIISAAFNPQPEVEILQCLKSPDPQLVWLSLRLGTEDRRRCPPVEGISSDALGYPFSSQRWGPTSGSTAARPAPWTAPWPAFPLRGTLLRGSIKCCMLFSLQGTAHLPGWRHPYLGMTLKNKKQ